MGFAWHGSCQEPVGKPINMQALLLRLLLKVCTVMAASAVCAQAQTSCPPVNFQTAVSANLEPSTSSHIVLLRQSNGSYTGYEMTNQSPYRIIRKTQHLQ